MGFIHWLLGRTPDTNPGPKPGSGDHAVLLHIRLSDDAFGADEDRAACFALEESLQKAIESRGSGEYDGNEFGQGFCTLSMYSWDADLLWESIEPVLEKRPFREGSYALRRYGPPGSREERIDMHWDG